MKMERFRCCLMYSKKRLLHLFWNYLCIHLLVRSRTIRLVSLSTKYIARFIFLGIYNHTVTQWSVIGQIWWSSISWLCIFDMLRFRSINSCGICYFLGVCFSSISDWIFFRNNFPINFLAINYLKFKNNLQGVMYPALHKLVSKWAPPEEKGKFV